MRFLALLLVALLIGCDPVATNDVLDRPVVLAPEAFAFAPAFPDAKSAAGAHFNNAAFRVGVVSGIISANLILPSAATSAAARAQPVVEDGVWIWETTVRVGADDVTVRLEGEPVRREVLWRLGVTTDDLNDFTLYTARSDFDGASGDWQLYYQIDNRRTEVLRADFEVFSATSREITFSVPPGRDGAGSTVLYTHDGAARGFDWHQEPENRDHLVDWDAVTHIGSITAGDYNGGARACWDADLNDTACGSAAL